MTAHPIGEGLVILDRDGVINEDSDAFIKTADEWLPLPGSIEAIAALSKAGYTVAVASNQSGLARGLFDEEALGGIHLKLHALVEAVGGRVDRIVWCPHGPDDGCDCRKPKSGLFEQLRAHYGIDFAGVPAIGDSLRDLEAAAAAGARPILVRTGNGRDTESSLTGALADVPVFDTLGDAVSALLERA